MEYFGLQRVARRIAVSRRGANPLPISVSLEDTKIRRWWIFLRRQGCRLQYRLAQNIELEQKVEPV